jgi:hypothetical protein
MPRTRAKCFAVIVRLDRTIQYSAAGVRISGVGDYWMSAFAGMTTEIVEGT